MSGTRAPRHQIEKFEDQRLSRHATRSTDAKYNARHHSPYLPDMIRPEFQRDYTRILHSRAFRRLRHKTQVFISPSNDHICTRMEHSLYVASVAQTIARALQLNEDLVLAIAIGHDLGHSPFGHRGEKALNKIAEKNGFSFCHELHSLRVVDLVERAYREHHGLNLTFAVRDGIVCHYGEGFESTLKPDRNKDKNADLSQTKRGESRPATLEGCVVRWADKVAYLGRDLEDALITKLIEEAHIPPTVKKCLGCENRLIINKLITELCNNSDLEKDEISIGEFLPNALNELKDFSIEEIYCHPRVTRHFTQVDDCRIADQVLSDFLRKDIQDWDQHSPEQLAIDFIAGMTDSFFADAFTEWFVPRNTV